MSQDNQALLSVIEYILLEAPQAWFKIRELQAVKTVLSDKQIKEIDARWSHIAPDPLLHRDPPPLPIYPPPPPLSRFQIGTWYSKPVPVDKVLVTQGGMTAGDPLYTSVGYWLVGTPQFVPASAPDESDKAPTLDHILKD